MGQNTAADGLDERTPGLQCIFSPGKMDLGIGLQKQGHCIMNIKGFRECSLNITILKSVQSSVLPCCGWATP